MLSVVAYLLKQSFQVKTTRTYFSQQFHDDLKLLFQAAGIGENKQQVVFIFDDTQVAEETFLEDINNILSTGEVRIKPSNMYGYEIFHIYFLIV